MSLRRKLQRALEREGWGGTLRLAARNLLSLPKLLKPKQYDVAFDQQYHVETGIPVELSKLDIQSPNFAFGMFYGAVTPGRFHAAMKPLQIDHSQFTFVDLGSGKGRALLLAAGLPFKKIVGVEFARELHEIALRNLETYTGPMLCKDVEPICEDATKYVLPDGPVVIFMCHPFLGKTMTEVVDNIERSVRENPRDVYVVYVNPKLGNEFASRATFRAMEQNELHCVFRCGAPAAAEAHPICA